MDCVYKSRVSWNLFLYRKVTKINFSKDVRLPVHLQRAMATEAEAAREARAKVKSRDEDGIFRNH